MRITSSTFSAAAAFLWVTACSTSQPAPTPAPGPPVVSAPAPALAPTPAPVSGSWTDWPIAPGGWVYRPDSRGSLALFGPAGSDASFMIRCDRAQNRLFLSRVGSVVASANMTLRASSGLQSYPARNTGGTPAYVAISVVSTDYMLDRIAFSRGRFAIETTGLPSMAIPIWPEFTRVVEDCRA